MLTRIQILDELAARQPKLLKLIRRQRMENYADDILQDVAVQILSGAPYNGSPIEGWLVAVTRSQIYTLLRKLRGSNYDRVFVSLTAEALVDHSPSVQELLENQERMDTMRTFVGLLRPAWRKAALAYLSGHQDRTCAGKTNQHRALLELRLKFAALRTRF